LKIKFKPPPTDVPVILSNLLLASILRILTPEPIFTNKKG